MRKISKKLAEARKKVDANKIYSLKEAIQLAQETSYSKFDGSIDLSFNLNLDVKQSEQQLRGTISLPYGNGKSVKILVATEEPSLQKEAQDAGADLIVGQADLTQILSKNKLDYDLIITEPKMMPFLAKHGRTLGPKGLMPNPKTGTVTNQIGKTVEDFKKGKANYRTDKAGIINTSIGKVSMNIDQLVENAQTVINFIKKAKPSAVKGVYLKNLTVSSTMGPSIKISVN